MNKFEGFPTVNYLSIPEARNRRFILEGQFEERGIIATPHIYQRHPFYSLPIVGNYLWQCSDAGLSILTGHLKTIHRWLLETDEPYTMICEDDFSMEPSKYWNFTWKEFFDKLPQDWELVITSLVRFNGEMPDFCLRPRDPWDWGVTSYIIKREYAEKLIESKVKEGYYDLNIPEHNLIPMVENVLCVGLGKVYVAPLFIEGDFLSTYEGDKEDQQKQTHIKSRENVLNWWKTIGKDISLEEFVKC